MPKYLFHGSYGPEGTKGLLKEGGSQRRANLDQMIKQLGGSLEAFYYTFGDADVVVIAELPDNVTTAAVSLAVNASGIVQVRTTVLLTAEEMDRAAKKTVSYRAPGR